MSRFDLHPTRSGKNYLLDLQTDLLDVQRTRMMGPVLLEIDVPQRVSGLHPYVMIGDDRYILAIHLLAAVPQQLILPPVMNLAHQADEFTRALDLLFQGY